MTEITTAEELDALPDGTRVRDRDGDVWEHWGGEWHTRETRPFDSAWLFRKWAPLTVLPDAPAPAAEDRESLVSDVTLLLEAVRNRCSCCAEADGELTDAANRLRTTLTTPAFTPAQRHAAEQDEALFRVATRAQFGTGEVVDIVLRALGVPVVAPVVSAEQVMNARDAADEAGPPDEAAWCVLFLRALGIEVQDRG